MCTCMYMQNLFMLLFFQSMELLILSKLKWDLTAITSYDYLDYMINYLPENSASSSLFEGSGKIRKNTEKLVTLCATDETFVSMPPSLVAGAALITAIEQDSKNCKINLNLNQIVACIQDITNLELVSTVVVNIIILCH